MMMASLPRTRPLQTDRKIPEIDGPEKPLASPRGTP
jgi:hypothetical protein